MLDALRACLMLLRMCIAVWQYILAVIQRICCGAALVRSPSIFVKHKHISNTEMLIREHMRKSIKLINFIKHESLDGILVFVLFLFTSFVAESLAGFDNHECTVSVGFDWPKNLIVNDDFLKKCWSTYCFCAIFIWRHSFVLLVWIRQSRFNTAKEDASKKQRSEYELLVVCEQPTMSCLT